ncbi:MAG: response regulator [Thermoanaerobaculaceae bacterium]|jgi:CheY-like chemotaxis protein|nr:response regulator [Thermoanaerobaculaceae bacterium]
MRQPQDVTVLVVDDDPDVTTYLGTILADAGMHVVTAQDGDSALQRIREAPPSLISLDLVMPGKSGIRLLHELRKHPEWSRIPVLIVTGHARDEAIRRDLSQVLSESTISGPSLYLEKPVTPEKYLEAVCNTLKVAPPSRGATGGNLREEAEALLATASETELEEVLQLLRARKTRTNRE